MFKRYFSAKARRYDAKKIDALRSVEAGEKRTPSWAEDEGERDIFLQVIRQKARGAGVSQEFLQSIQTGGDVIQNPVYYAGALEHHGASFAEQQMAASEALVKLSKLNPAANLSFRALQDYKEGMSAFELGDFATALEKWQPLADKGIPSAQTSLGAMYKDGKGVTKDYFKAKTWFRIAADQGNAGAQYNLGLMYYYGNGIPQDYAEAMKWYLLAAKQGVASAQINLGVMYYEGQGSPQDYVTAHLWAAIANSNGHANGGNLRDLIANAMTAEQISEAQRRARVNDLRPLNSSKFV